jgi:3-oxoacyl-[acyl-carrier protein] reductase
VPQEKIERLLARQAIPRLGIFEDGANVTDFYLKKESGFITGQYRFLSGV